MFLLKDVSDEEGSSCDKNEGPQVTKITRKLKRRGLHGSFNRKKIEHPDKKFARNVGKKVKFGASILPLFLIQIF